MIVEGSPSSSFVLVCLNELEGSAATFGGRLDTLSLLDVAVLLPAQAPPLAPTPSEFSRSRIQGNSGAAGNSNVVWLGRFVSDIIPGFPICLSRQRVMASSIKCATLSRSFCNKK